MIEGKASALSHENSNVSGDIGGHAANVAATVLGNKPTRRVSHSKQHAETKVERMQNPLALKRQSVGLVCVVEPPPNNPAPGAVAAGLDVSDRILDENRSRSGLLDSEMSTSLVMTSPLSHKLVELPRSSVNMIRELNNLNETTCDVFEKDKAFLVSTMDINSSNDSDSGVEDETAFTNFQRIVPSSKAKSPLSPRRQSRAREPEAGRISLACGWILKQTLWKVLVTIATFHMLFVGDLYLIVLPKSADRGVLIGTAVVAALLLLELVLNFAVVGWRILLEIFFWLDVVAWASVLPDVLLLFGEDLLTTQEAGSAPNLALARVSRVVRIAVRLGRIGQLAKHVQKIQSIFTCGKKQDVVVDDFEDIQVERGRMKSQVGREIEGRLTKKNVMFTLCLILGTIMLSDPAFNDTSHARLLLLLYMEHPSAHSLATVKDFFQGDLLCFKYTGVIDDDHSDWDAVAGSLFNVSGFAMWQKDEWTHVSLCTDLEKHRDVDITDVSEEIRGAAAFISLSRLGDNQQARVFSVCLTLFVVICLLIFNYVIANDVQKVLVEPIERMMRVADMFMKNPLAKFNWKDEKRKNEGGETAELIKSMKKLGNLIQVGFGEAGAEIVSQNLRYGALFTMFPGSNVQAVFCFCDIRNFTSATESLRHDVMFFVNHVAEIVHATVNECGGSPNKNIGDAFLCIWRLGEMRHDNPRSGSFDKCRVSAENALYFSILTRDRIARSESLSLICDKVGANYTCQLGFGLHFGWAVEGAIGSALKVDVSYLSPHVNMAARLEAATKQFGVRTLMSAPFYSLLSRPVRDSYTRPVDVVVLKGTSLPVAVYEGDKMPVAWESVDMADFPADLDAVLHQLDKMHAEFDPESHDTVDNTPTIPTTSNFYKDYVLTQESDAENLQPPDAPLTHILVKSDDELERMQEAGMYNLKTMSLICYAHYVTGEWDRGGDLYNALLTAFPDDRASVVIYDYMSMFNFRAPRDWRGYRVLGDK